MDNENSVIYGLEFQVIIDQNLCILIICLQARSLASVLADTEKICFLIGTQSLKQATNQVHLVEFNDEDSTLKTLVYNHPEGEIWKLNTSPLNPTKLATCYNFVSNENSCSIKTGLYRLPEIENRDRVENLELITEFDTGQYGNEVKTTEFHPIDENKGVTVMENHTVLWDVSEKKAKEVLTVHLTGKNNPKFTTGKWNPHQNCNQVIILIGQGYPVDSPEPLP